MEPIIEGLSGLQLVLSTLINCWKLLWDNLILNWITAVPLVLLFIWFIINAVFITLGRDKN